MVEKKVETKVKATAAMYDALLRPVITEKTSAVAEQGKIVFAVAPDATKATIKKAIEAIYDVKVKAVNIAMKPGKTKRFKGVKGKTSDLKKAYITLADGANLDIMSAEK